MDVALGSVMDHFGIAYNEDIDVVSLKDEIKLDYWYILLQQVLKEVLYFVVFAMIVVVQIAAQ